MVKESRSWNYSDTIRYLNSFIDFERLPEPRLKTEPEDIERFRHLLEGLGSPERCAPVIHVVGTKGKGSTSRLITSILSSAGYRVGLNTSPHLVSVRERVEVDGKSISKREFARVMAILRDQFSAIPREQLAFRTVFEHLTAAAFLAFQRAKVDVMVIEAGLGAKLDATIVVDPALTVITPIGLDHIHVLGDTIALIAEDKAHAVKRGKPTVSAPQVAEAQTVIQKRADVIQSRLVLAPGSNEFDLLHESLSGSRIRIKRAYCEGIARLSLAGRYQLVNLSTALTAVEELRSQGFKIKAEHIRTGLRKARWPGRMQVIDRNPLTILDGAHNTLAVRALVSSVESLLANRRLSVVFSSISGKPTAEMLQELGKTAEHIYLTELQFPKGLKRNMLEDLARDAGCVFTYAGDALEALRLAQSRAPRNGVVLVTGSLYLAGEVLRGLKGLPLGALDGGIDPNI